LFLPVKKREWKYRGRERRQPQKAAAINAKRWHKTLRYVTRLDVASFERRKEVAKMNDEIALEGPVQFVDGELAVAGLLRVEAGDRVVLSNARGKFAIHALQPRFVN
jgi:hypothetical protein